MLSLWISTLWISVKSVSYTHLFGFNPDGLADDFAGSGGTLTTSGVGCSESGFGSESGFDYGGSGGVGGAIASAGADGILGNSSGELRRYYAFGKGGAAGKAIVGKSFITYEVTGTITGVQLSLIHI